MTERESLCPVCGNTGVVEKWDQQSFDVDNVTLSVRAPLMSCHACGLEYTDYRAEEIRHEALCHHLGFLSPREIKNIREEIYGMSRKVFSSSFGFGEASLERWENGKTIQNKQTDNYIRLLSDKNIGRRVLSPCKTLNKPQQDTNVISLDKFRALKEITETTRSKASMFSIGRRREA